jgi:hypothetical protein
MEELECDRRQKKVRALLRLLWRERRRSVWMGGQQCQRLSTATPPSCPTQKGSESWLGGLTGDSVKKNIGVKYNYTLL